MFFSAIFPKGNNLFDFLFSSAGNKTLPERSALTGANPVP